MVLEAFAGGRPPPPGVMGGGLTGAGDGPTGVGDGGTRGGVGLSGGGVVQLPPGVVAMLLLPGYSWRSSTTSPYLSSMATAAHAGTPCASPAATHARTDLREGTRREINVS